MPPESEIFFQARGYFYAISRRAPIFRILTIIEKIMKLNKIAYFVEYAACLEIVGGGEFGFEILCRQVVMKPAYAKIGHENGGCLQGLDEAGRKAQRDAVLDPGVAHTAGSDGDYARLAALGLIAVNSKQLLDGFLFGDEPAGEDITSSDTCR